MHRSFYGSSYEPPVSSETFYVPNKPPFLFKRANQAFAEGRTRRLSPDWNVYISLVAVLVVALIATGTALPPLTLLTSLNQHGQMAPATISGRRTQSGKSTWYYVQFVYKVNNQAYTAEQDVSASAYATLTQGTHVTIRYVQDAPTQARLWDATVEGESTRNNALLLVGAWTIAAIGGCLLGAHMLRNRAMAMKGQIVDGVITASALTRSKSNYQLTLTYSFTPPNGRTYLTRKESINRTDLREKGAPAPSTPVKVLYLNDNMYRVL